MSGSTIRVARPDDVPFLRRMQWEALLASPQFVAAVGVDRLREMEEQRWAVWPADGETAFVAEDARGRPCGAVMLRVHERGTERAIGYRLAIAVEACARGQGVGRALLERAKQSVREAGADYLFLLVDTANEPAIGAYRAVGFQSGDPHGVAPMIFHTQARRGDHAS
jgi:ribosomal protein S18 acetylase RimI-like enzyme